MSARLTSLLCLVLTGLYALWLLASVQADPTQAAVLAPTLPVFHGLWCWWAAIWLAQHPSGWRNLLTGNLGLLLVPLPLYATLHLLGAMSWQQFTIWVAVLVALCASASVLTTLTAHTCGSTAGCRLFTVTAQLGSFAIVLTSLPWLVAA